ncbi:POTRA domain-containing protein [Lacihabitans soyangensis]|uniref:Outer membrane protein assembly factor n=1 Tax=Lacihabitans soyangensis TaxID=869394 RepID=A0AAE3H1C2_9BACT|nr:POTRA domain-containing protein [Lacihabitans soyangensis]MCP9762470.1 outer membrane protein assembly factor [Lacihabitans soyangensis]
MKIGSIKRVISLVLIVWYGGNLYAQNLLKINKIEVSGNSKTKEGIILRELNFKVGDSLSSVDLEKYIERSKQNLINTNLFLTVNILYNSNDQFTDIYIVLKERWYLVVLPEVLLADRSLNEWWYERNRDLTRLTYGINAKHFNLSGNNDQLRAKIMGGFVPYFELSYAKPYIDKRKRIGIRAGAFYSTQRTMAYRTWNDKLDFFVSEKRMRERKGAIFELRLRNALYHFHTINLGYTNTTISDTISKLNPNYFGVNTTKQEVFSFTYDYRFDQRDNRQYPLSGKLLYTQLSNFYVKKGYNQTNIFGLFSFYKPLNKSFFWETSLRAKLSTPQKQYYPLITGLGFSNNLVRGYELYVIDGQNYGLWKNTLKYELLKKEFNLKNIIKLSQFSTLPLAIYPNIYFDSGYIKNYIPVYSNSRLANKLLNGGGVGLDIVTWYNSNVRIYYSINQKGEKKFFFGISRDM